MASPGWRESRRVGKHMYEHHSQPSLPQARVSGAGACGISPSPRCCSRPPSGSMLALQHYEHLGGTMR